MELYYVAIFLACISYCQEVRAALSCLACTDSPRSRDCQYTTRCGIHEQCNVKITMIGRSTNNVLICSECCQGNLCNSALCGAEKGYLSVPLTSRGPVCFSCDQQLATDTCHVIKECGRDEECMLKRYETQVGHDMIYKTDCVHVTECEENLRKYSDQTVTSSQVFGRRSSSPDNCLLKCCRSDLCNEDCTGDRVVFSSSVTGIPVTDTYTSVVSATSTVDTTSATSSVSTSTSSTSTASTTTESTSTVSTSTLTTTITAMPGPDAAFCRNKSTIVCDDSLLELCTAFNADGKSYLFTNRCNLMKAMCYDPHLKPVGCQF